MALDAFENEDVGILTFGMLVGGSSADGKSWEKAIWDMSYRIDRAMMDLKTSLKLNVVFHIPGNMLKPEFIGVRTGTFSKKMSLLMVQVAIPEALAEDVPGYIKQATHLAIDEAARWAIKRRLEFDATLFHGIVERAAIED
jgi:hypothetical protein